MAETGNGAVETGGLKFNEEGAGEAAFDAAFAELDKGQVGDDPEPEAAAEEEEEAAEPVQARAGDDDDAGDEDDAVGADDDDGEDDAPPEVGDDDEEMERALLALRYSRVPSTALKHLSRDELISWGKAAAEGRAKTEAALEERATKIRELEAGAAKVPGDAAQAQPDWSPQLKVLAEKLGLDPEDAQSAFQPVLEAVMQSVRSEFDGRLSATEKQSREAREAAGRTMISDNLRRLEQSFPKLASSPDLRSRLQQKALTLFKSGEYQDAESMFDDAAKIVLGPLKAASAKRRNGVSNAPTMRSRGGLTDDNDDLFLQAMDRIEARDKRGAMRIGSRMSSPPSKK